MAAFRRGWLILGAWLLVVAFAACSNERQLIEPPNVVAVSVERLREDGLATTRSQVVVTFDSPVEVRRRGVPLASHFELRLLHADGSKSRVLVASATRSDANRRAVILEFDSLVTNGSTLVVARRLFDANAVGSLEVPIAEAFEPTVAILASRALTPADPGFYDPPAAAPADPATDDAAAMRERLREHLTARRSDARTTADALALFDAIPETVVRSPKLRAALAGLVGTFAEPALADLLTNRNCTGLPAERIVFEDPPGEERLFTRVTYVGSGARVISIDPGLRDERFELLMPLLAHEAIHCDQFDSKVEEVVATAFDTLLFLQLAAADPTLGAERTRLARELRIDALAMLNSGGTWPESVGVLRSPGVDAVLPATNVSYPSFGDMVAAAYPSVTALLSPTEPLAAAYAAVLADSAGREAGDPFNLRYLDSLLGEAFELRTFVDVITAFGLEPVG